MRFAYFAGLAAMLIPIPAQAAIWPDAQRDSTVGSFVGVRIQLRSGGPDSGQARTSLAIAPTRSAYSSNGEFRTRIGEGLALEFSSHSAPRATLAGKPVNQVLRIARSDRAFEDSKKLGISTGGWVAIGVGVAAVAGVALFYHEMNSCDDHDDEC